MGLQQRQLPPRRCSEQIASGVSACQRSPSKMQRYSIKFCAKLNKTATETFGMIQEAYKEEAMSRAMVFMWHKRFKDGCKNVEDDDRAERPSTSRNNENLVKVCELLNTDRRLSVKLLADELGLGQSPPLERSSPP